jgi:hypothetical protein
MRRRRQDTISASKFAISGRSLPGATGPQCSVLRICPSGLCLYAFVCLLLIAAVQVPAEADTGAVDTIASHQQPTRALPKTGVRRWHLASVVKRACSLAVAESINTAACSFDILSKVLHGTQIMMQRLLGGSRGDGLGSVARLARRTRASGLQPSRSRVSQTL